MKKLLFLLLSTSSLVAQDKLSLSARFYTGVLRSFNFPEKSNRLAQLDSLQLKEYFSKKRTNYTFKPPLSIQRKFTVESSTIKGKKTYFLHVKETKENKKIILYLHGGGYIFNARKQHWKLCAKLAKATNYTVAVPDYPLAPEATWAENQLFLEQLYAHIIAMGYDHIILAGDSAGGGLALGFYRFLAKKGGLLPKRLVLIAPWLEPFHQPIPMPKDVMLGRGLLTLGANLYAPNQDSTNSFITTSSLPLSKLPPTLILVGSHDLLFEQNKRFAQNAQTLKLPVQLIIGHKLQHVYPLWPIPEAKIAQKQMISFILNKKINTLN
jgi:epsilon-lactone hydrolase